MRILDVLNQEVSHPDLAQGYLKQEDILVQHHDETPGIPEEWHYEVAKTYSNGGQDLKKIIDKEGTPPKEAWDEYETISRYILYTPEELTQNQNQAKLSNQNLYDEIQWLKGHTVTTEQAAQYFSQGVNSI